MEPTTLRDVPWTGFGQRAHAHLVQAEGVRAVVLIHVVRRDDVLQALAHLAELAVGMLAVPCERRLAVGVGGPSTTSAAGTYWPRSSV